MLLSMTMARPQRPDILHAAQAKAFERFYWCFLSRPKIWHFCWDSTTLPLGLQIYKAFKLNFIIGHCLSCTSNILQVSGNKFQSLKQSFCHSFSADILFSKSVDIYNNERLPACPVQQSTLLKSTAEQNNGLLWNQTWSRDERLRLIILLHTATQRNSFCNFHPFP